jgi:hypothetical protein
MIDPILPEFVWFMKYALILVAPLYQMDFIIKDIVVPLSEKRSDRKVVTGGGKETARTAMRYWVFECETELMRPKSLDHLRRNSDGGSFPTLSQLEHPSGVSQRKRGRQNVEVVERVLQRGQNTAEFVLEASIRL